MESWRPADTFDLDHLRVSQSAHTFPLEAIQGWPVMAPWRTFGGWAQTRWADPELRNSPLKCFYQLLNGFLKRQPNDLVNACCGPPAPIHDCSQMKNAVGRFIAPAGHIVSSNGCLSLICRIEGIRAAFKTASPEETNRCLRTRLRTGEVTVMTSDLLYFTQKM